VFEQVLDQCQAAGLLKGRVLGTDSTVVDANASMDSLRHKSLGCTYEEYMVALKRQDQPSATKEEARAADRKRGYGKASNEVWESATDPEARVMQHADGHTHLSYRIDATVDLETGVIVATGAEYGHVSDQADFLLRVDEATVALAERDLGTPIFVADKGHHSGENLAGLEEREVVGLISSPRTERGQPGFRRSDFSYDAEHDLFRCPAGETLARRSGAEGAARQYQARGSVCQACPHFGTCTKSKTGRSLRVPVHEDLIQANRERVRERDWRPLLQIRRQRGEGPFGYYKQFGGLRRVAGRGLDYAQKKTLVAGVGWNLLCLLRHARGLLALTRGGTGWLPTLFRAPDAPLASETLAGPRRRWFQRPAASAGLWNRRLVYTPHLSGGC
jgi:hypothetical protein